MLKNTRGINNKLFKTTKALQMQGFMFVLHIFYPEQEI